MAARKAGDARPVPNATTTTPTSQAALHNPPTSSPCRFEAIGNRKLLPPTVDISSAPGRATGLHRMVLEAIAGGLATLKAAGRQLSRAALQQAAPARVPVGCELAPLRALRDATRQAYEPALRYIW